MHLVSYAIWSLVGLLAYLGAVVNAAKSGVVEIDLVFPRNNETYAPTDKFPIVFAVQNAKMAKYIQPTIGSHVFGWVQPRIFGSNLRSLRGIKFSSDTEYVYHYVDLSSEVAYQLYFGVSWNICNMTTNDSKSDGQANFLEIYSSKIDLNIKKGGQPVDLVAATANNETCSATGVAINVTDETRKIYRVKGHTCVVLEEPSSPTINATRPCRVQIDTAAAASISAASSDTVLCESIFPSAQCPKGSAAQKLVVAGVASFAAAFSAIGFLLA